MDLFLRVLEVFCWFPGVISSRKAFPLDEVFRFARSRVDTVLKNLLHLPFVRVFDSNRLRGRWLLSWNSALVVGDQLASVEDRVNGAICGWHF